MTNPQIWYAAHVVLLHEERSPRPGQPVVVMENVYLFRARTFDEARQKAETRGKEEAGFEVEVDGRPAVIRFAGVRKVVSCGPNPDNSGPAHVLEVGEGIEATYSFFQVADTDLATFLDGELVPVILQE